MKRVLITGAGSYVGNAVQTRLEQEPEEFQVDVLDMQDESWREKSFAGYDSVFHVAGIAHVSPDPSMEPLYMKVNRDLAIEAGKKAKADGVPQFVFMSSSIVYGDSAESGSGETLAPDSPKNPANFYGRSKLEAEEGLEALASDDFHVAILRCPIIYGPFCKGNFPRLVKLGQTLPFFPDIQNEHSMLYIKNLAELVAIIIRDDLGGLFMPQNSEYVCTSEAVRLVAEASGKSMHMTKVFNPILCGLLKNQHTVQKAFGDMKYQKNPEHEALGYQRYTLEESIRDMANSEGWQAK